jgi:hypothetical protein
MLIYYDLTARIFTRNVITQVVERHLLLGMLRLFNPIEILRMQDTTIEAIAAENKETRDRRKTLQAQKKAIEEAKTICASLAMRSELRAYEDDPDDDTQTDDDEPPREVTRRQVGAPQSTSQNGASQGGLLQTQPTQPTRTSHESVRKSNRDSRDDRYEREEQRSSRPPIPTQDSYQNGSYRQEPNRDWEPVYHAQQAQQAQPGHAPPPPPPRPSKVGLGDTEAYYDNARRQDSYNESPGRSERREGARHRLANAMRMGN